MERGRNPEKIFKGGGGGGGGVLSSGQCRMHCHYSVIYMYMEQIAKLGSGCLIMKLPTTSDLYHCLLGCMGFVHGV